MARCICACAADGHVCGAARRGFTLIELLVSIGILGLLVGLVVPGLSAARRQSMRVRCLANLHALVLASGVYATESREDLLIAVHPVANRNPLHDEGFFDYGGKTGARNVWEGRRLGPLSERTAETRPLNRILFAGAEEMGRDGFTVFRCPADTGIPSRTHANNDRFWDPALGLQPLFDSVGTSYGANAYRARSRGGEDGLRRFFSVGLFLRATSRVPFPSQTVFLYEGVMWYNAASRDREAPLRWQGVRGWHGERSEYNVAFADAHVDRVPTLAGESWRGQQKQFTRLYLRGRGFRFDCLPSPPIEDPPTTSGEGFQPSRGM
ncbi:MAG: type II secretion system protein [Planctomycetota bacterium]|nr:MAG: type II secretion system protein [Planctomycetota bacterium]